jgi:hypothetical protein
MSDFLLFAQNLAESSAPLVSIPSTTLLDRLRDRDRGPQWTGANTGQHDITLDLGTAMAATYLALVNHNLMGSIQVAGSSTGTFGAAFSTATVNADPFLLAFGATQTWRYFNLRITAGSVIPQLGELLLGVPQILALPPFLDSAQPGTIGNVQRDRSPGGYRWAVKRGAPRARFPYRWTGLSSTDLAALELAYAQTDEGAKNLLIRDELNVAHWVSWESDLLQPMALGQNLYEVPGQLFEAAL